MVIALKQSDVLFILLINGKKYFIISFLYEKYILKNVVLLMLALFSVCGVFVHCPGSDFFCPSQFSTSMKVFYANC